MGKKETKQTEREKQHKHKPKHTQTNKKRTSTQTTHTQNTNNTKRKREHNQHAHTHTNTTHTLSKNRRGTPPRRIRWPGRKLLVVGGGRQTKGGPSARSRKYSPWPGHRVSDLRADINGVSRCNKMSSDSPWRKRQ